MSGEYVARHETVKIDLHEEPSYVEVPELDSPEPPPKVRVPHVVANNNPTAIYAMVNKKRSLSRSMESLVFDSAKSATSTSRRRISFIGKPLPDLDQIERFIVEERKSSSLVRKKEDEKYQQKVSF